MRRHLFAAVALVLLAGCGGDDLHRAAFCGRALSLDDVEDAFDDGDVSDAGQLRRAADEIADLADDAPGEVADDLGVIATTLGEIADVVADADLSDPSSLVDPANPAAVTALAKELQDLAEDVEDAQGRVDAYLREACRLGVDDE